MGSPWIGTSFIARDTDSQWLTVTVTTRVSASRRGVWFRSFWQTNWRHDPNCLRGCIANRKRVILSASEESEFLHYVQDSLRLSPQDDSCAAVACKNFPARYTPFSTHVVVS